MRYFQSCPVYLRLRHISEEKSQWTYRSIEQLKDKGYYLIKGNNLIKEGKFQESYDAYTEALSLDQFNNKLNAIIYSNRALTLMKDKKFEEAL